MARLSLFGRSKQIEYRIDEFLDKVSGIALVFEETLHRYLETGEDEAFTGKLRQASELKRGSSRLRREIETELYGELLIPDLRGDVASLIELLHNLVERMHQGLRFSRHEHVKVPKTIRRDVVDLVTKQKEAVEQLVYAARAFFRNFTAVRDHIHKVGFYESESDELADRLLGKIQTSVLDKADKLQLMLAIQAVDAISDAAERIADNLTIWTIKRSE